MTRILVALLALFLAGCSADQKRVVTFGFIPGSAIEEIELTADTLSALISQKTGMEIRPFVAPDYSSLIEAMRTGHVDLAWLAPMSYVDAVNEVGVTPLLTSVRQGKPYFYSAIFVRTDSGIRSIDDLKGKVIAFSDPLSTAGRLFPEMELRERGIQPENWFRQVVYLGGHDKVVHAVFNRTVDAGASFSNDTTNQDNAWKQFLKEKDGWIQIRPILFSRPIPGDVVGMASNSPHHHDQAMKQLAQGLMRVSESEQGKRLIRKINRTDSFSPADSRLFENVREAARLVLGY